MRLNWEKWSDLAHKHIKLLNSFGAFASSEQKLNATQHFGRNSQANFPRKGGFLEDAQSKGAFPIPASTAQHRGRDIGRIIPSEGRIIRANCDSPIAYYC